MPLSACRNVHKPKSNKDKLWLALWPHNSGTDNYHVTIFPQITTSVVMSPARWKPLQGLNPAHRYTQNGSSTHTHTQGTKADFPSIIEVPDQKRCTSHSWRDWVCPVVTWTPPPGCNKLWMCRAESPQLLWLSLGTPMYPAGRVTVLITSSRSCISPPLACNWMSDVGRRCDSSIWLRALHDQNDRL